MKMKPNLKFKKWLLTRAKEESIALAMQAFAQECKPVVSFNTIQKWVEGSKPRAFFCDSLRGQFPDCPLFAKK